MTGAVVCGAHGTLSFLLPEDRDEELHPGVCCYGAAMDGSQPGISGTDLLRLLASIAKDQGRSWVAAQWYDGGWWVVDVQRSTGDPEPWEWRHRDLAMAAWMAAFALLEPAP